MSLRKPPKTVRAGGPEPVPLSSRARTVRKRRWRILPAFALIAASAGAWFYAGQPPTGHTSAIVGTASVPSAEKPGYAGAEACRDCHRNEVERSPRAGSAGFLFTPEKKWMPAIRYTGPGVTRTGTCNAPNAIRPDLKKAMTGRLIRIGPPSAL